MADHLLVTDLSALWFLMLIPAIVLLYMVRSRYRRRQVSSTMLWRSVRRDLESRQKLRLPPLSLLMLLQLLAVAIGTAALLRPALPAESRTHLVVVIDTSASMQATDVTPSRFALAAQRARQAIEQLRPGDQVSLVAMGPSPTLMASGTETSEALAALDQLSPGTAAADAAAALKLAESLVQETGGQGGVVLLSDGSFAGSPQLPVLGVPVDFRPIGVSGDNLGITAAEVRPDLDGSGRWTAFARITNYAQLPAQMTTVATADGLILDTRQMDLPPASSSELTFALPPGTQSFALALDGQDIFQADDRAEVRVDTPQSRKVLLVSADPEPIEKVLKALPGLKVSTVQPDGYAGAGGADVVVLDGFVPRPLPQADLLIMNPPMDAPGFSTSPGGSEASVLRSKRGDPLIDAVDLQSLRLGQTVQLETPEWARAIVEGPGGPLILKGDLGGRRVVLFSFDWFLYDLPRMQAFPLLLSNAVAELNPLELSRDVRPGDSVLLRPLADATEASVELPDGSSRELSLAQGAGSFGDTQQVGRYAVRWKGPKLGEVSSSFNVNVSSESQSDITPRSHQLGQGRLTRGFSPPVPGVPLWPIFAVLLLGLLTVEWAYFARRG
ncbi:MAG: VWA domain-containing protein [Chloroflexota bacterium]